MVRIINKKYIGKQQKYIGKQQKYIGKQQKYIGKQQHYNIDNNQQRTKAENRSNIINKIFLRTKFSKMYLY